MHIEIKKGLDIPLSGEASGEVKVGSHPKSVALDLAPFFGVRFSLKVREGDSVALGQPLAEDKECPGRMFVSPAGGRVVAIERGEKRRLLRVVIDVAKEEERVNFPPQQGGNDQLIARMLEGGMFARILKRPCSTLADPQALPSAIFVQAIESAPYAPPISVDQSRFDQGLAALAQLATVHVVGAEGAVPGVQYHTASGPHPIANPSVHIYHIDPILRVDEVKWTLHARDVEYLGGLIEGVVAPERVVSVAGDGVEEDCRGHYRVRDGVALQELIGDLDENWAVVSGDPLMGARGHYLGMFDNVACTIKEACGRQPLHFCGLGANRYTASKAYLSAFLKRKPVRVTTNQHGEGRAFVDSAYYDKFMPMKIPTVALVKAILANDFETAIDLGLLEVSAEDFALGTFACPSKIEMVDIMRKGLFEFAQQYV